MILIIARYTLAEGKKADYLKNIAQEQIIEKCRKENGNIAYEFLSSNENPNEIIVLEKWENEKVLDIHSKASHFKKMMEIKESFGASPSQVEKYII